MPIPLIVWGAVAAAAYFASGCSDNKSDNQEEGGTPESGDANAFKNPIDEYVGKCDDAARRMSKVAACGQFQHQTDASQYLSSASLHIPQNNTQQDVDQLLLSAQCMIKCAWAAPAEPKYNKTGGLCEYLLRVSQDITYSNGSPYIYNSTITTEQSQAYDYFDYCLGYGYLP